MARLSADERKLLSMFAYMRPMGSTTEQVFVDRFLTPLGFTRDPWGNLVKKVGDLPVLFSSLMDTVHATEGLQTLDYSGGVISLSRKSRNGMSSCLGADDTAGIWLMMEMVKAGVPGTFVIHHGEERGCIGSRALAEGDPDWLRQFDMAIAFDRAGKSDVITHQSGERSCSDAFARSLCRILGGDYAPCAFGAYTDTAQYTHLIPECTNISVGYLDQHTRRETQEVAHLVSLRDALLVANWSEAIVARDPSHTENYYCPWGVYYEEEESSFRGFSGGIVDAVREYPEIVSEILESMGISRDDVFDTVKSYYG